jgi:hypothetical protein
MDSRQKRIVEDRPIPPKPYLEEWDRQVVKLQAEVKRLRAALAPFAKVADDYDDREDDNLRLMVDADQIHLRVRDVRAARTALKD